MGSEFLSVTWYTGKRNVARKRISPINCQSNLATQKISLPCFYDLPPASSSVHLRLNFRSAPKKARPDSSFEWISLSHILSLLCNRICRCSFDNDENANIIASDPYRFAPLGELRRNPDKTPLMRKRERERKSGHSVTLNESANMLP